jgi:hypothetical protein
MDRWKWDLYDPRDYWLLRRIFQYPLDSSVRQWVREHIDWDWLRDWLRQLPEPGISDINFSLSEDLQDFRVIDVLSNCVIHIPPNSQYLALSYVWGSDSKDHIRCLSSNVSTLSQPGALRASNLPRTISDAILVCQNLGYRFLWADRLCIMQDDSPESLSKQLNQMANIYNRAALTLVAATGVSATHGLAGVSHARDARQKVCKYGKNFELTNPTPLLEDFLPESKWWTRGWTYQEYIASKRLLFFTNYGLRLQNNRTSDKIFAEGFSGIGRMQSPELDFDLIEGYTRKDLTHDSDILHASSGFLRALIIVWYAMGRFRQGDTLDTERVRSRASSVDKYRGLSHVVLDLGYEPYFDSEGETSNIQSCLLGCTKYWCSNYHKSSFFEGSFPRASLPRTLYCGRTVMAIWLY